MYIKFFEMCCHSNWMLNGLPLVHVIAAPPSNIEIQGYGPNSKVEVHQNQDLTLKCIVSDAKPASQIQWFRNNVEIKGTQLQHF